MNKRRGFTVIELLLVIAFLIGASVLFFVQKAQLDQTERDTQRKVAVNAMYYNLEEVFFEKNSYYPEVIDSKNLRAMDPKLFTDPNGVKLGDESAEYRYEPTNCTAGKCISYTLRADLEREDDFVKQSRNK